MNSRQLLQLGSIRGSLAALEDPKFDVPAIRPLKAKLRAAILEIESLTITQAAATFQKGSDGRAVARIRRDLRKRLIRLSTNALVALEGFPGIRQDVKVPHANASHDALVSGARRIIKNVRPHLKTLHANGLPKGIIAEIESLSSQLLKAVANPETVVARRSRATASLPGVIRRARTIIRAVDATVKSEFSDDFQLLHKWTHHKRVGRKTGRPRKKRSRAGGLGGDQLVS